MSKPVYWIVHHANGREFFNNRARARGFAMIRRAHGEAVRIEAKGF